MKTSISFLKSNYSKEETISLIENTDADYIHVDIMDGIFVNNKVLSIEETINLLSLSNKKLDIHLMVANPLDYIEKLAILNPEFITIHAEINQDILTFIELIHSKDIKAGIAINPDTKISMIKKYLDSIEYVLIMGVYPGEGGQSLIKDTTLKIKELEQLRKNNNYNYLISFDGGVNGETRKLLEGLDCLVSGSYVCLSDNYQEKIDTLK